jgi:hypothetical protein
MRLSIASSSLDRPATQTSIVGKLAAFVMGSGVIIPALRMAACCRASASTGLSLEKGHQMKQLIFMAM